MAKLALSVSQQAMKVNKNKGQIQIEVDIEQLNQKMEKIISLMGENKEEWRNSVEEVRKGLKTSIEETKEELKKSNKELKIRINELSDKIDTSISETKSEFKSDIEKVVIKITNDNKIILRELSRLTQYTAQTKIDNNNIVTELAAIKQIFNNTNNTCKNNNIDEMKKDGRNVSKKISCTIANKINKVITEVTKEATEMAVNITSKITGLNEIFMKKLTEINEFTKQNDIETSKILTETNDINEINNGTYLDCENDKDEIDQENELQIRLGGPATNCAERHLRSQGSGIRMIYPFHNTPTKGIRVVCDQDTEGGGWTVFQTRDDLPIRENFYRNWTDYSTGFGDLSGEFWLGLENIHRMTRFTDMELRINLEDESGAKSFAKYESFFVESSKKKYRLSIGSYSGNAGDELTKNNQMKFSTLDEENDESSSKHCAKWMKGAWWYKSCSQSNLNGYQFVGKYSKEPPFEFHGIWWSTFTGADGYNSLRKTKMMFRPQ